MSKLHHFTSVTFKNYKALKNFSISLTSFNVLVGPNNSGKSTIISAFRILAEGMRKAVTRNPEYIHIRDRGDWGYRVPLDNLPIATENIFSNYDSSQPASITFRLSNSNLLKLVFPEPNLCYLICENERRAIRSIADFKREYNTSIGFVPVLGPVEHDEPLYKQEAARQALLTHRASRNFRNIWYHYSENFDEFRELIRSTWPGLDIEKPEIDPSPDKVCLRMFCPEERFPREIFWAGFGFQVWCQMLTYIVRSKNDSLLIIDEPEIYLHADLQRQLVGLLKNIGPDVLLATHSTEIISEADPGDLLIVNKKTNSAKRIKDPTQLQNVFEVLGSNLNPTLTQLAKSRRALFVEGKDFRILSVFARCLGKSAIANRSHFAVIPVEGFNPQKMYDFSKGMELTLGRKILKMVVFDRDYRSHDEVSETIVELEKIADIAHIHKRKEIENYLLIPKVLDRALKRRVEEHCIRANESIKCTESMEEVLHTLTTKMKTKISGHFLSKRSIYEKAKRPGLDAATINQRLLEAFEIMWSDLHQRLELVPGKEILSQINTYLQDRYKVTLSSSAIINAMTPKEVPEEIKLLIHKIEEFQEIEA